MYPGIGVHATSVVLWLAKVVRLIIVVVLGTTPICPEGLNPSGGSIIGID